MPARVMFHFKGEYQRYRNRYKPKRREIMKGIKLFVVLLLAFLLFLAGFWYGQTDVEIEEMSVD